MSPSATGGVGVFRGDHEGCCFRAPFANISAQCFGNCGGRSGSTSSIFTVNLAEIVQLDKRRRNQAWRFVKNNWSCSLEVSLIHKCTFHIFTLYLRKVNLDPHWFKYHFNGTTLHASVTADEMKELVREGYVHLLDSSIPSTLIVLQLGIKLLFLTPILRPKVGIYCRH